MSSNQVDIELGKRTSKKVNSTAGEGVQHSERDEDNNSVTLDEDNNPVRLGSFWQAILVIGSLIYPL